MEEKYDRLDDLESALSALEDAQAALKAIGLDDVADYLGGLFEEVNAEADEIRAEISIAEKADQAALEREYWATR